LDGFESKTTPTALMILRSTQMKTTKNRISVIQRNAGEKRSNLTSTTEKGRSTITGTKDHITIVKVSL
jgi:hypothetical protein